MSNGGILRRPAVPPPVRIRRDVNNLLKSDPHKILEFYGKAIREMQKKRLDDPLSWRYQAAIHDYPPPPDVAKLFADKADKKDPTSSNPPPKTETDTYWRKCEHGSWFFLSWHRMYLHYFEKIIMGIVAKMPGGPTDWALPYWNYSSTAPNSGLLPRPFWDPPNDSNPLFARRTANANKGVAFLDPDGSEISLDCLKRTPFAGTGLSVFGGPQIHHHDIAPAGALENAPHNLIHGALGQDGGLMNDPGTAALDPIFWLHHSNIDRLWEVWVQRQKMLQNRDRNPRNNAKDPALRQQQDGHWLDDPFDFHDGTGAPIRITSREVLNTRLAPLSYEYEDTSDPFNGAPN
jgi:tyrosinase